MSELVTSLRRYPRRDDAARSRYGSASSELAWMPLDHAESFSTLVLMPAPHLPEFRERAVEHAGAETTRGSQAYTDHRDEIFTRSCTASMSAVRTPVRAGCRLSASDRE